MTPSLPLLLLLAAPLAAAPAMTARFFNGDRLPGSLESVEGETAVWDSPAFFKAQPIAIDKLDDIRLPAPPLGVQPEGDHIAIATLTNDDEVRGSLRFADEERIVLHTTFAGPLEFRRDMVSSLEIESKPEIHYAGPRSLDEWRVDVEGSWSYDRGELICEQPGGISREIGEHLRYRIAFDLAWSGNARFRLLTSADDADPDEARNCYELVCQSSYAYVRKRTSNGRNMQTTTIGTTGGVREFREREKVRLEFLHDRVEGRLRLILDGRMVAEWREPQPGIGEFGGHFHLICDQHADLRVSRIEATSWAGATDEPWQGDAAGFGRRFGNNNNDDEDEEEDEPKTGITLANGDHVEGETGEIRDGMVTLETPLKTFQLPVSRLRSFSLRTPEEAANPELCWKPIRRAGDVRATFAEGGHITFELAGFDGASLIGRSQTFGEAEFDVAAFKRIEFNIYRDAVDE